MEIKQNDATYNRPEGDRVLDAPLVRTNIAERIAQLKSENAWLNGDRNAITILHSDQLRVVLMAIHQHAEVSPHTTEGATFLQILEGRIWIETLEQSLSLDEGETIALAPNTPRSFFAEKDCVVLLTLTGTNNDDYSVNFNHQSTF